MTYFNDLRFIPFVTVVDCHYSVAMVVLFGILTLELLHVSRDFDTTVDVIVDGLAVAGRCFFCSILSRESYVAMTVNSPIRY